MLEIEEIDFTPEGLGPWSISKLKMLRNCPFQFFLKYVVKKKPDEQPPISVITETGKAAHRILEFLVKGRSIGDSFKEAKKEFEGVLTSDLWASEVETLELSIQSFSERLETFEKKIGIKRFIPELRIGVNKDWEPTGFFAKDVYWRGVVDLVIQLNNGDVIILDHKTSAPPIMGVRAFKDQLEVYKLLIHYGIEKIKGAQSGIHFVKAGEIILDEYTTAKEIEESLKPRFEFYTQGAIDRLMELGFFKHIRSAPCKWCDFNDVCKEGKLKELELSTKKYFPIKAV